MPKLGLAVTILALTAMSGSGNTASVAPTVMGGSGNAASVALVAITGTANAASQDPIEALLQHPPPRAGDPRHHAHSDFTDPLGRFMDSLAAGAFADARALQPAACNAWRTSRQTTAVSGKFRVWDTEIDLDTLCPAG